MGQLSRQAIKDRSGFVGTRNQNFALIRIARLHPNPFGVRVARCQHSLKLRKGGKHVVRRLAFKETNSYSKGREIFQRLGWAALSFASAEPFMLPEAVAPCLRYIQPGPWKLAVTEKDVIGVWLGFGVGAPKQYFIIRKVGGRLRGMVCGTCDNPYTMAALDDFEIQGELLKFLHEDWQTETCRRSIRECRRKVLDVLLFSAQM